MKEDKDEWFEPQDFVEGAQDKGPPAQNTNRKVGDIHDLMSYLNETPFGYERSFAL
jgi:hypothetical protein